VCQAGIADRHHVAEAKLLEPRRSFRRRAAVHEGHVGTSRANGILRGSDVSHGFAAKRAAERSQQDHERGAIRQLLQRRIRREIERHTVATAAAAHSSSLRAST
jgi:hypothetical protein